MSMEAKMELLNEMDHSLRSIVTKEMHGNIMESIANVLSGYSIEVLQTDNDWKDDLLDAYLSALSVEGKSEKTLDRYRYVIQRMMNSVKTNTKKITVYHLRKYLSDEKSRGIADSTLEGVRQVFTAYFNWLQREQLIEINPTANLGAIKCVKKQKDVYSDTDMERMKFACKSIRDRAIISFLRATGCRISEMTGLNRTDIDLVNLECKVLGKGNKERIVYLDQVTAMLLGNYLNERKDDYAALFIGKGSDRLKPGAVRNMLIQLGKTAHVEHVHPHKFRRTTATNLIRHGMPIQEVAAILGHDKLDTTMQYVVLDKTDIKHSYRKYA